jgi:hypothetical protein
MPYVDPSVPAEHQQNIDGLAFLYLVSQASGNFISVGVHGSSTGSDRIVISDSNFDPSHVTSAGSIWEYDTYYRLIIESSAGQTRVSLRSDADSEIFGLTRNFGLSALGGPFNVGFYQVMGTPDGEYYSDAALDRITVSLIPEPPGGFICVIGAGMVLLTPLSSRKICHSRKQI